MRTPPRGSLIEAQLPYTELDFQHDVEILPEINKNIDCFKTLLRLNLMMV